MKESSVRRKVVAYLKASGFMVIPYPGAAHGMAGVPDLIAIRVSPKTQEPQTLFVELKRPGGRLSGVQRARQREMERHGADIVVVSDLEHLKTHLRGTK